MPTERIKQATVTISFGTATRSTETTFNFAVHSGSDAQVVEQSTEFRNRVVHALDLILNLKGET